VATERANRGTDWVEARDFWLSLPPHVRFSDVPQFGKHAELILGEATERIDPGEAQDAYSELLQTCIAAINEGWSVSEFLERVRGRLGEIGEAA
jgi:hypothetical protein